MAEISTARHYPQLRTLYKRPPAAGKKALTVMGRAFFYICNAKLRFARSA